VIFHAAQAAFSKGLNKRGSISHHEACGSAGRDAPDAFFAHAL
jgi:hypothetical protein